MSDCSCGRPARPLAAVLLIAPLVVGALGAAIVLAGKELGHGREAAWGVGAVFAVLVAALVWLAARILTGAACAGCGRARDTGEGGTEA